MSLTPGHQTEDDAEQGTPFQSADHDVETSHPIKGLAVALTGIAIGFFVMLPNAMMGANDLFAGTIGSVATLLFFIGGIYGGYKGEAVWLAPAVVAQLIALLYLQSKD